MQELTAFCALQDCSGSIRPSGAGVGLAALPQFTAMHSARNLDPTNAFVNLHAHFAATGLWAEPLSDLPLHLTDPFAVSLRFLLAREAVAPGLRFRVRLLSPSADGSIDGFFRPFCTHVRFDVRPR